MELYNVATKRKEAINDPAALREALLSGTHSYASGSEVIVRGPDNKRVFLKADDLVEAMQYGYQPLTAIENEVEDFVDQNKNFAGSLKVFAGQFADEALLGLPELIFQKKGDPLEVAKLQALKKEHALANLLGGVGGFGASMLTGAPLWRAGDAAGKAVTRHVAEKLATVTGQRVADKGVKGLATRLADKTLSKGLGGAAEGGIVALPHFITESALGDPAQAAETILAGMGAGALLGSTISLGGDFWNASKKARDYVLKTTAELTGEAVITGKDVARKGAKVVFGVDDKVLKEYQARADEINMVEELPDLKAQLDDAMLGVNDEVAALKAAFDEKQAAFKQAGKNSLDDVRMIETRPDAEIWPALEETFQDMRKIIGSLAEQAEDEVARLGDFTKAPIVKRLRSQAKKISKDALADDPRVGAAAQLRKIAAQIDNDYPDLIPGDRLRGIMKSLREQAKWDYLATEFNSVTSRELKKVSEAISDTIKAVSDRQGGAYTQYMKRIKEYADTLEQAGKYWGDRDRALNSAAKLYDPKGKDRAQMETLQAIEGMIGRDLMKHTLNNKKAKEVLNKVRREGDDVVYRELVPGLAKEVDLAKAQYEAAVEATKSLRFISPANSQSVLERVGSLNKDYIRDRQALEYLSQKTGIDFVRKAKDRKILDSFQGETTQGSQRTNMLGALGFGVGSAVGAGAGLTLGGPVGAAAGAVAGAALDKYGKSILKTFVDRNPNVSGLLFGEKSIGEVAKRLDELPNVLRRMSDRQRKIPKRPIATSAIWRILDSDEKVTPEEIERSGREGKVRGIERLNEKLTPVWAGDTEILEEIAFPFKEGGAPQIGEAMAMKAMQVFSYINEVIPKPPRPTSAFAPNAKWRPNDYDVSAFEQKLQVIQDPLSVIDELESRTLTKNHMDALKQVYPTIHNYIVGRIMESASQAQYNLSYQDRVKLSLLAGAPIDETMTGKSILYYQQTLIPKEQDAAGSEQSFRAQVNVAEASETSGDKLQARL